MQVLIQEFGGGAPGSAFLSSTQRCSCCWCVDHIWSSKILDLGLPLSHPLLNAAAAPFFKKKKVNKTEEGRFERVYLARLFARTTSYTVLTNAAVYVQLEWNMSFLPSYTSPTHFLSVLPQRLSLHSVEVLPSLSG